MPRVIFERPYKYYTRCASYCKRRVAFASDPKVKWFWMATAMRFEHMKRPEGRRIRFGSKPWRYPTFKY
jgi:hypothetical protein